LSNSHKNGLKTILTSSSTKNIYLS